MRTATKTVSLHPVTIEVCLTSNQWLTASQVCNYLQQCGLAAFRDEMEMRAFQCLSRKRQYQSVYNALMRISNKGRIDRCLGTDDGKEVRVFKLF